MAEKNDVLFIKATRCTCGGMLSDLLVAIDSIAMIYSVSLPECVWRLGKIGSEIRLKNGYVAMCIDTAPELIDSIISRLENER